MKIMLRILIGLLVLAGCALFAESGSLRLAESYLFLKGIDAKCSLSVLQGSRFGAFATDGKRFAMQDGAQVKIYEINQTKTQKCQPFQTFVNGKFIAFSPKGTMFVVGIGDFGALQLYKTADQKKIGGLLGDAFEAFNERETRFVLSQSVREKGKEIDRKLVLYNATDQKQVGSDILGLFAGVDTTKNQFVVTRSLENGFSYSFYDFDIGKLISQSEVTGSNIPLIAETFYPEKQLLKISVGSGSEMLYSIPKQKVIYPQGYTFSQKASTRKEVVVGVNSSSSLFLFKSGNVYAGYDLGVQKNIFTITTQAAFAAISPQGTLIVFNNTATKQYELYSAFDGKLVATLGGIFQGFNADGTMFAAHEARWDRVVIYENTFFKNMTAAQRQLLKPLGGIVSQYPNKKFGEGISPYALSPNERVVFDVLPVWLSRALKPYLEDASKTRKPVKFMECDADDLDAQLIAAVEKGSLPDVTKLIAGGACVNAVAAGGMHAGLSALMIASIKSNVSIVKALLAAPGIDVNQQDTQWGRTALLWAVAKQRSAIIPLLLNDNRVDLDIKGKEGNTALMLAQKSGFARVVKLFK